jgi:biopolymer transport protein ExbB
MAALIEFLATYKIADIMIALIGLFGITVTIERFKALYVDYNLPSEPFMAQVMALLNSNRTEEAITFCSANAKKPLAMVIKRVLERSDRDSGSIEKSFDIATSEVAPKLMKNLNHLPMIANVATMLGLLGTVVGLILAFQAIALAGAADKQMLLAQGISAAMTATAAGLAVAIPIMFLYSFLYTRQTKLFSEIDSHALKVIECLNDRVYLPFSQKAAYPSIANDTMKRKGQQPPSAPPKVS